MSRERENLRFVVHLVRYDGTDDVSVQKTEGCQVHFKVQYSNTSLRTKRKLIQGGCCVINETFCFGSLSREQPRLTVQLRKNAIFGKSVEEKIDLTPIGVGCVSLLVELASTDRIANFPEGDSPGSSCDGGEEETTMDSSSYRHQQQQQALNGANHEFKAIDDREFRNQIETAIRDAVDTHAEAERVLKLERKTISRNKRVVETEAVACGGDDPIPSFNTVACQTLIVRDGQEQQLHGGALNFDEWESNICVRGADDSVRTKASMITPREGSGTGIEEEGIPATGKAKWKGSGKKSGGDDYCGELRTNAGIVEQSIPSPHVEPPIAVKSSSASVLSATRDPDEFTVTYFPPVMRDNDKRLLSALPEDAEALKRTGVAFPTDDFEGMATYCEWLRSEKEQAQKKVIEMQILLARERAKHLSELGTSASSGMNDEIATTGGYSDLDSLCGGGSDVSTLQPRSQQQTGEDRSGQRSSGNGVPAWVQQVVKTRGSPMSRDDYMHLLGEIDAI